MTPGDLVDVAFPVLVAGAGMRLYYDWRHKARELGDPVLPPFGKAGLIDRWWHPFIDPVCVGDVETEFFETHIRILAMSKGYKTTLLAYMVRHCLERGRPVVVLTGGDSDQLEAEIRAHGGYVIRPESSPLRFNCFEGSPAFMAQTWAQLMPTAAIAKVQHGAFEQAALSYFESTTSYSVQGLKAFCLAYEPDDDGQGSRQLWRAMKENYLTIRMTRVEKFLGSWIGDELSINDCVRKRIPLMFVIDSKDAPDLHELEAALVWQGICHAVYENGNSTGLDAFVDEFGRLPTGLIGNPVRTWRRNKSRLVGASHTDRDFEDGDDDILGDLFHTNVLGRMVGGATRTRKAASEMTWGVIHPTAFGPHALGHRYNRFDQIVRQPRKGYFWLVDAERVQEAKVVAYKPPKGYKAAPHPLHFLAGVRPSAVSAKYSGTGDGTAVTRKAGHARVVQGATESPEPRSQTPLLSIVRGPMYGPPECPPIFLTPFATQREMDIWLRHRFPQGIEGDWELDYYCNPQTGRPEMQWVGSPARPFGKGMNRWMAYAVVLALWDLWEHGWPLASEEAAAYLWDLKEKTKKMQTTVGHDDAVCRSKKCGRREHMRWLTNRENVAEQKVVQAFRRRRGGRVA